jgi:hypothetical protein
MTPIVVATNEGLVRVTGDMTFNEMVSIFGLKEAKVLMTMIMDSILEA